MTTPIAIDLPHELGAEEARRRLDNGLSRLSGFIPGGAEVAPRWDGNRLHLDVGAMGQSIVADMLVTDTNVHLTVSLPPALAMFSRVIEAGLERKGRDLLEDRRADER